MAVKEFEKDKLTVRVYDTRKEMGDAAGHDAAEIIRKLLKTEEEVNIIFAAAPSQNETLAALLKEDDIDWSRINAFHMDEYIGLPDEAPQRFGNFLKDRIFGKRNFKSVNYISGNAKDIEAECERYTALLKKYPVHLVCL